MAKKKEETREMELLLATKELVINGKTVVVKKVSLLNSIRLASHLSSVVGIVLNNSEAMASAVSKLIYKDESGSSIYALTGFVELMGLLGEEGADLLKDIIVKTTNLEQNESEDISAEDGVDLILAIYEVNKGFFMKSMNKLKEKLQKAQETEK